MFWKWKVKKEKLKGVGKKGTNLNNSGKEYFGYICKAKVKKNGTQTLPNPGSNFVFPGSMD